MFINATCGKISNTWYKNSMSLHHGFREPATQATATETPPRVCTGYAQRCLPGVVTVFNAATATSHS